MIKHNINDFVRGWFVGGFEPRIYETTDVEVAVQYFQNGDKEASHCHKIATEITMIVSGKAKMRDTILNAGEIVMIEPGEFTSFEALEDTVTTVVKLPGALNDKYIEEDGKC